MFRRIEWFIASHNQYNIANEKYLYLKILFKYLGDYG
jgi:hypothetical protein